MRMIRPILLSATCLCMLLAAPVAYAASTAETTTTSTIVHRTPGKTTATTSAATKSTKNGKTTTTVTKKQTTRKTSKTGATTKTVTTSKTATHPAGTTHAKTTAAPLSRHAAPAHPVAKPAPPPPAPVAVAPPPAKPAVDLTKGSDSGLPLPRFLALRSDQVSLRAGPGYQYPIDWVYQRRYLPVKIEREFQTWRLVSEPDGTRGWIHQAMLTGRRGFLITGEQPQTMRDAASDTAVPVAILKPGVVGRLLSCAPGTDWCQVQVKTYRGYLNRSGFWGTMPGEVVAQ